LTIHVAHRERVMCSSRVASRSMRSETASRRRRPCTVLNFAIERGEEVEQHLVPRGSPLAARCLRRQRTCCSVGNQW
jgi:hypothetical protein